MNVEETVKKVLEELRKEQMNLQSSASIELIAKKIAAEIKGKFYSVPYSSQESFEE
jgi:hypothetical protein